MMSPKYRTRSVRSLLSSTVPLSNILPQKLVKNINLEGKNKALSDIVRTLQKLKEIQAAGLIPVQCTKQ